MLPRMAFLMFLDENQQPALLELAKSKIWREAAKNEFYSCTSREVNGEIVHACTSLGNEEVPHIIVISGQIFPFLLRMFVCRESNW